MSTSLASSNFISVVNFGYFTVDVTPTFSSYFTSLAYVLLNTDVPNKTNLTYYIFTILINRPTLFIFLI